MLRTTKEELQEAIVAHSQWKYLLQEAIRTGDTSLMVKDIKSSRICELGKWLNSLQGKNLPNYTEIIEIHRSFHEEAALILTLAFNGRKAEAEAKMQLGSRYNQLTAKLVNKLLELKSISD